MADNENKQSPTRTAARTVSSSITGGVSGGVTGGTLLGFGGAALAAGGFALIGIVLPAVLNLLGVPVPGIVEGIAKAATGPNIGLAALIGGGAGAVTGVTGGTFLGGLSGAGAGFRNSIPGDSGPSKEELIYMERAQSTAQGMLQGAALTKLEYVQMQQEKLAQRQQRHEQQHTQQEPGYWVKNHTSGPKPQGQLFVEQIANQDQQPALTVPGK